MNPNHDDTPAFVIDPSFDSGSEDDNSIVCADCAFYRTNHTQYGKCLLMPIDMDYLNMPAPHNDKCEEAQQKKCCLNCENLRCAPSDTLIEKMRHNLRAEYALCAVKENDYRELVEQYIDGKIDASDIGAFFCMRTGHRRCFTHRPETHVCPDWELSEYTRHKFW
jgi:hypothetical protein